MSAYRGHCLKAPGRDTEPAAKPDMPNNPGPFVCNVLMIVTMIGIGSPADALWFGLVIDTGDLLAMRMTIAINRISPSPFCHTVENANGFLTGTLKTSDVLFAMRKTGARLQPICEVSRSNADADARGGWPSSRLRQTRRAVASGRPRRSAQADRPLAPRRPRKSVPCKLSTTLPRARMAPMRSGTCIPAPRANGPAP